MASLESVEPQAASSRSVQLSLSSSVSSVNPVVETPSNWSGIPSLSVSIDAAESFGNASGPAVQTFAGIAGTTGPSQTPSPSVSAFHALVPVLSWST